MIGRVDSIQPSNYGFIVDEHTGIKYFFHKKQYLGDFDYLKRISPPNTKHGPIVHFKPFHHAKGERAEEVELLP